MMEYQIEAHTRRCAVTGRELRPGEKVYSVLLEEQGKFVRKDYGSETWQGPPPEAFSFWAGRVPSPEAPQRPRIDGELLMDCFQRLEGQTGTERVNFRYVVALLLLRCKRLKFEASTKDGDQEILRLRCGRTGATYQVLNPCLTEEQMTTVQEEVFEVLGWE